MKDYKTVKAFGEALTIIEKSKFISYCFPVATEEQAQEHIRIIKKKHYDANHNVWAYVLGEDMAVQRYQDDKEPSGTAGIPTLEVLRKTGITNSLIIVTRYFGGIKLGAGGLVRAYTKSAIKAVSASGIIEKKVHKLMGIQVDYNLVGRINQEIKEKKIILRDTKYSEAVEFLIYVEPESFEKIKSEFINITNDKCLVEDLGEHLLTITLEDTEYGD